MCLPFLALTVALSATGAEKPRLVILELSPGAGVDAATAGPLTEAITAEVQARGLFDVLSSGDLKSLLGLERQRQLMGCSDEKNASCMAELSGALGARFVMTGTLAKLGEAWQLTLTTLDSTRAQPVGRATRFTPSLEGLRAELPYAVAEATGTPLPPPPSRALPIALLGTGGAAAIFGLVWGAIHLAQEQQLAAVLDAAGSTPGLLNTRAQYELQVQNLTTQKWLAGGALLGGAVLILTGILLMPDTRSARVALVPTGSGVALVGVWP